MVRKILSQIVSTLREGIAWGLAYSPPSRITALLEPLAAEPAPRRSSPPWPEVVAHAETTPAATDVEPSTVAIVVSRVRDGAAMLLFFLWHCEIRSREELYAWRHALRFGWGL
jgi:hypothetical protein